MKKIIVTGATSFIGNRLIEKMQHEGYFVYAVIRENSLNCRTIKQTAHLNIIECNLDSLDRLPSLIDTKCDVLVHLAWEGARGTGRNDPLLQESNYRNSLKILDAATALGARKIITAGSQAEYGIHKDKITEETLCLPNTEYGRYKLKLYNTALELSGKLGFKFIEPRFFSIYGPGDHETTMVTSTIRKMLRNEDCPFTDATQLWDFLYVDDAADAVFSLVESDCESGAYNIAKGESQPLCDYIKEMHRICQSNSRLLFGQVPYTQAGKVNLQADVSKLRSQTGWKPQTEFKDGIAEVISYCRRTEKNEN
jgi:nucleoside-diphosphate-sugar epimerase